MDFKTYCRCLEILRPGCSYAVHSDSGVVRLDWSDPTPAPTADEMAAAAATLDAQSYREKRAVEYPPFTDQLDAIMKGGQALADMQALCMAVKAKFPKP